MESVVIIVAMIIGVMFFKSTLRKGSQYLDQVIDTNINEEQADLIERSMAAYDEVIDRCGPDFKTPDEVLSLLRKKNRRNRKTQPQAQAQTI